MSKAAKDTESLDKFKSRTAGVRAVPEPSYLVQFQRGEGQTAIFCFLFVGGFKREFATFAGLAPLISRRYSFYGVIARGTDGILDAHGSVEEMAAAYIRQMKAVQPHGPYFMLGECFSATVAYETAQQLRAQGERVGLLAFLDARVPGTTMNRFLGNRLTARVRLTMVNVRDSSIFVRFREVFIRFREVLAEVRTIRKTQGTKWLGHLLARIGKTVARESSTPPHIKTASPVPQAAVKSPVDPKSRRLQRAETKYALAVRRYERRPYPGKIAIIASSEFHDSNPTMGWNTVQELEVHEIPGKHETYLRENQQMVVRFLRDLIEKAEQETGPAGTVVANSRVDTGPSQDETFLSL